MEQSFRYGSCGVHSMAAAGAAMGTGLCQQILIWLVPCSGVISADDDRLAGRYQKPAQPVGRQANRRQSPISRHC